MGNVRRAGTAADTRWLELRRQCWYAVVYVPPALHGILGKKLRQSLSTRDLREAQTKRHPAVADFKNRIAAAQAELGKPAPSGVMAEAHMLREATLAARNGATVIHGYGEDECGQAEALRSYVADRAEQVLESHGEDTAGAFYGIASGTRTPIRHHVQDWLREGGQKGSYKERTKLQLDRDLRELEAWLATAKLPLLVETLDRRTAGRFVTEHLAKSGRERKTVQRIVSSCRSYWTWLGRKGIADDASNPWDRQAPPKGRDTGDVEERERPFTEAELVALLAGPADAELADLMRVAALSGMRIDEPYRLLVRDCADSFFTIRRAKTKAGVRRVPIHPDIAPIVARRVAGKAPDAFLFPEPGLARAGRERSMAASKRFGYYRKRVGVAENVEGKRGSLVTFHSFRRWFITTALRNGQAEHVVQQVVGHRLQGVTLGVYHGGDTAERLRACVEGVRLPEGAPIAPVGKLAGPSRGPPGGLSAEAPAIPSRTP